MSSETSNKSEKDPEEEEPKEEEPKEELVDIDREKESNEESEEGEQTLQLGDVILFKSPENDIYDNNKFIIDYIDEDHIKLINIENMQQKTLQIKDGILGDGTIKGINLIYRNPEKGYARQNGLLPDKWVNVYFGGEYPAIITGRISNLESDMIEITLPDNDVIYLNFGYKGIPEDLPIETIELREPPEKSKSPVQAEAEEAEEAQEAEAEAEVDAFEDLEDSENENDDEYERPKIDIQLKEVKDQAREFIIFANELEFGEELGPIKQYVGVEESQQRYNIDYQTNDLLDELLSDIPSVERTTSVLNNIHIMIERFKQLRTSFSIFDDYGNVLSPIKKDAQWKPLAKDLEKFKTALYWLLPIAKNRKKLYNVKYDEVEGENTTILSLDLTTELEEMQNIVKIYKSGTTGEENMKYATMMSDLNPYLTPFDDVNPESIKDVLYGEEVQTNINAIIDNLGDFYSSVAVNDNIKTRRFLIQKYNLGLSRLEATNLKGSKMISHRVSLTPPDFIQVSSIMTLPEPTIRFSKISLPSSSIMEKANLNINFLNYWQVLNSVTNVEKINIVDLENDIEFNEEDYFKNIKNYVLVEKDNNLSSYENYKKFLNVVVPKTRVLFNLIKKYIKGKLTLKDVVEFLEPFLIYTDDLTYMQYNEINKFLQEKMLEYKRSFVEKSRAFALLKNVGYKQNSDQSSSIIENLLEKISLRKEVFDSYDDKILNQNITNSELLKQMTTRDFGNFYNIAVSLENIILMLPDNVNKFLEDEAELAKNETKQASDNNICKKYVIAKQYSSMKDLEEDNGKTIYFDKIYDKTNYGLLDDYEKEQIEMRPDEFEEFLKGKLISKHNYNLDEAPYIADALLNGMKAVSDGDLAIVYLSSDAEYSYYTRENNKWIKTTELTDENIVSNDDNVLCNLQKDCIEVDKKYRASCDSFDLNKAELSESALKQMINAFDKKYKVSKELQEDEIKKKFDYLSGIMESLEAIEKNRKYKNNKQQYELGVNDESEEAIITSPYTKLRDAILGTEDFVKKQNDIVKFCARFTRESTIEEESNDPRNQHWLYCIKTNTQLMPLFYLVLAKAFLISQDHYQEMVAIVIKEIGKLSDDGDMWVDENSGYPIKAIDYDVEEGYEESGFKRKTRDILDEDAGENILKTNSTLAKAKLETKESRIISNIVTFLSGSMGINMSDSRELITKIVLDALRVALTTEAEHKEKVQEMAKKGKKLPSYAEVYNLTILYLTLGAFLIAAQTSIPGIKTRKTYPGCVRSFNGYPIEGKNGDMSGIKYLACIAEKSKSSIEPWTALKGSKIDKIQEKIMAFTDNYLLKHSDVIRKIEEKVEYLNKYSIGEEIPDEYNLLKWNNFLPPLVPFKIKSNLLENISSHFKKSLLDDFKSGSGNQREKLLVLHSKIIIFSLAIQEKIQNVVNEKKSRLLLTNSANEPFLDNSCCNEKSENNTIQYFEETQPDITQYNAIVKNLENLLYDINAITIAPFLFSRENTKNIYPPLTDQYNEETIYLAFIKYCKFTSLIPMNEDFLPICADKPDTGFLTPQDSLSEMIRKLKQIGRDYNSEMLLRLIQVVERNNIIDINVNPVIDKPIQKMRDLIESITAENDKVIPEPLLFNINGILDSYDLTVEDDTQEMKALKNYLGRSNENMKQEIVEFIKENAKLSKLKIRDVYNAINGIMKWESMEVDRTKERVGKSITDSIKYNSIKFVKEFMRDIISVFPNIILNKVDYSSVKIQNYLKLSRNHQNDIRNSIRDYYSGLRPFYHDNKLVNILKTIQNKCKNLLLLALETPSFTEISYNGKQLYNIFDRRTSLLLFENYLLQTLVTYVNLANDDEMVNLEIPEDDERENSNPEFEKELTTVEEIDFKQQRLEPKEIQNDIIMTGNIADLKERTAKLLIAFINIMNEHKSLVDMSYENIMDVLFKTKEKEKNTFTDRLEAITDEERDVDTALKRNKLGRWNKGLKKGLTQYVAEDYDDERDEMEKLAQVEKNVRKNKKVTDENISQYMDDYLEDDRVDDEINMEDNDLTNLKGEGDDSDDEIDQDDQESNQWSGWEPNEE
uniref:Uncharacterized protein n=1 Tax=viral metagenome TaxID=1070528 RepID=A0A6C0KY74_9ZZZZ